MGLSTTDKDEFSGRWPGEDPQEFLKRKQEQQKKAAKKRVEWLKRQSKLEQKTHIWLEEIIPNWDSEKSKMRVREMWSDGIPRSIRGKVWFLAFGNRSAITDDLFNIMADRGAKLKLLLKENSAIEQSIIVNGGEIARSIARLNVLIDETDKAVSQSSQQKQTPASKQKLQVKPMIDVKSEKEKLKASISSTIKNKKPEKEFEPSGDSRIETEPEKRLKQLEKLKDLYRDLFKIRKKLAMLINVGPEEDPEVKTKHQARERSILIVDTDIPRTFPKLGGIF